MSFLFSSQYWFSSAPYSTSISAFTIRSSSVHEHENHAFIFESKSEMGFLVLRVLHKAGTKEENQSTSQKKMNLAWLWDKIIQLFFFYEKNMELKSTKLVSKYFSHCYFICELISHMSSRDMFGEYSYKIIELRVFYKDNMIQEM